MRKWFIPLLGGILVVFSLATQSRQPSLSLAKLPLRAGLLPSDRVTAHLNQTNLTEALTMYSELTGRTRLTSSISQQMNEYFGGYLSRWHLVKAPVRTRSGIEYHRDGLFSVAEVKARLEELFATSGLIFVPVGDKYFRVVQMPRAESSTASQGRARA